jgi:hypothetical protein
MLAVTFMSCNYELLLTLIDARLKCYALVVIICSHSP